MTVAAIRVVFDCNIFVINLALKADAQLIVSRDRHLLDLADSRQTVGQDFQARFPNLHIIDPVELLKELE